MICGNVILCINNRILVGNPADQSVIQVDWALLPLLKEGIRDLEENLSHKGTVAAPVSCSQRSIQELQRNLLKAPPYHQYFSQSSVSSLHQEYFSENDLRQASWSAPAPKLVEHLDWARLGTAALVAVDLIGSCFSPHSSGKTATFLPVVNITTYIGKFHIWTWFPDHSDHIR